MSPAALLTQLLLSGCGPRAAPVAAGEAATGWRTESGWSGSCFVAPPEGADEKTLQDTLNAMALQWRGGSGDGVSFPMELVVEVRDLLRERPEHIPALAAENYSYCAAVMAGEASTVAWGSWLAALPEQLRAGECVAMLEEARYEYIDLDRGWQHAQRLCAGEVVTISASARDHFRLSEGGAWMTAAGDPAAPLPEGSLCREEGCTRGMLVGRFTADDGEVMIFPLGTRAVFTAPSAGELEVAINDDDFGDNAWQVSEGYADKTSVTYSPGG